MSYVVVFEHSLKARGYAGVRFYIEYENKKIFQQHRRLEEGIFNILAEDITKEQAQDLVACTPEICRITAAIEESFAYPQGINLNVFDLEFYNAQFAIQNDRLRRFDKKLKQHTGFTLYRPEDDSPKSSLYRAISTLFNDPHGNVGDLTLAKSKLLLIISVTR